MCVPTQKLEVKGLQLEFGTYFLWRGQSSVRLGPQSSVGSNNGQVSLKNLKKNRSNLENLVKSNLIEVNCTCADRRSYGNTWFGGIHAKGHVTTWWSFIPKWRNKFNGTYKFWWIDDEPNRKRMTRGGGVYSRIRSSWQPWPRHVFNCVIATFSQNAL